MTNLLQLARRRFLTPAPIADEWHGFQGNDYFGIPALGYRDNEEVISTEFATLVEKAYKGNSIVFASELTRVALFSEARFQWRRLRNGRPGDMFGTADLEILEKPWPGGRTGDLLSRMLLDADFGGTAFVARPFERRDRLMRMRPDWVTIVLGSHHDPDRANWQMDADFLGVIYHPGGLGNGDQMPLLADEVAVFAPNPDPNGAYRGVPWLQAVIPEVRSDAAATTHKQMFFQNGATPQVIVQVGAGVNREQFADWVEKQNALHSGVLNAYKTLYLKNVEDVHVVGKDLAQLDFKATQGAGETRIAAASGVHPVVVALSEGMAGSSLNAGNFQAAKRLVADRTLRPLWRQACAALEAIVPPPPGAQLWFDERDISFLQEDRKDAADIEHTKAMTIGSLVREGFEPASVIAAVEAEDMNLLVHTGLVSVQLQPPGTGAAPDPKVPAGLPARSYNPAQKRDPDGQWSDGIPGPAADPLKLAGRIRLAPGERFAGSAKVDDGNFGTSTVLARVDGPDGTRVRLGVVATEDQRRWSAEPKGRTIELDVAGAANLQATVRRAGEDGRRSIAEYRAELRKAVKAGKPVDDWPDTEADISKGTVHGARWGDLNWVLTREEGGDYISVAGEDAIDADLRFSLIPRSTVGNPSGEDFNTRSPQALKRLEKALGDLISTVGGKP